MSILSFDLHANHIQSAHRRLADAYARVPGAAMPVVDPALVWTREQIRTSLNCKSNSSQYWRC